MVDFIAPFIIIILSIYGLLFKKHIISKIIALDVLNTGIVFLFVVISSKLGTAPPIKGQGSYVDPFPQAVIITSIVVGFATISLLLSVSMIIVEKKRKKDLNEIEKKK
ncbi:NADH-ubiquinone oxidoreductase subunit 4L [Thermosipho melanesiensis]|uniref:NADH-ubiquinone oxidoreductase, chain 4L n=2 Tax=Thermosipho melanesiensis TaxID=46541 RepID=A6LL64_THEM4|nr:Na+/H+ antiporter subunit C [Thermosipho melanesiensis]ABR30665.1 NADH-ubiquinone oxidoreductase, chain 4L [Thermosipho melanesiensis BI429]APT73797.1 NADH-ubiquinone oxidoreductase subunit 4L [Thermosipho melanesiensis]OOC35736.1 NADH-ubiquinone oxidoreductase subunit 4L [Thermosipho melanesiensis]OOC39035.1 NADH-ubiquinone oxidoreductase subunit 4L [Thermosipho melanesiensis]OOC39183.1 NADH-ubiquinone oxidoreductase subunit 4L [Thermosipho melanesiensis]